MVQPRITRIRIAALLLMTTAASANAQPAATQPFPAQGPHSPAYPEEPAPPGESPPGDEVPLAEPVPSPAEPEPAKPLPGPRYAPLRYNDDFSYLDGPEGSYQADFFDPIKRIRLADDLYLRLGGEIRGRMEWVRHKRYGAEEKPRDTFFLHRYLYHANIDYGKLLRFYVEGINAFAEGVRDTPLPPSRNRFDAHQMFIDLRFLGEDVPLTVRFGRQELLYGRQRLVGPLGWANVPRRFDALKLFWQDATWNIDAFYARPVVVRDRQCDRYDEDAHLYGLYGAFKGIPNHGIDAYFLAFRDTGSFVGANLPPREDGDLGVYTMGGRFFGGTNVGPHVWDYETELAGQWGKAGGDSIRALMWAADTGYTLGNWPWRPRFGAGIDYASGDNNPFDSVHRTFNQLFPTGHLFFGYLDQIGRQNIWAQNVNLTLKPHDRVTAFLSWHTFWLDKDRDALYGVGGAPARRNTAGGVSNHVGHELDLTLDWQIDAHMSLLFGYSHLWTGRFLAQTGPSENPSLFYLMYTYRF